MCSAVQIQFSLDGERYQPNTIDWPITVDKTRELSRNISIPLLGKVARFIKISMQFSAKWILISEVTFESGKFLLLHPH